MRCAPVTPELWVGPYPDDRADFDFLKSQGITAILSLQTPEDLPQREPGWEESAAQSASLAFKNVPVTDFDTLDLKYQLPKCVKALDDLLSAGHRVYLHCTAGVNRSPTVAAAYLHWCLDWPLEQALAHVKEVRNCVPLGDVIQRAQRPARK
jgi:protein-tyrosine phosphatase